MAEDKNGFWKNVGLVFLLVSVIWIVQLIQYFNIYDFTQFANWPRHREGLKGIIFSPFLHDKTNFDHILSNTLPILVLLTVLLHAYPRMALFVLIFIHLLSGSLVWLLAPSNSYHIGISGIIYGVAAFLVASGIFRKDRTAISIAILVTLVYGGMVFGFLPRQGISWQSHLYGALSGILAAFLVRNRDLPPPHEYELEKTEEEKHFFDPE